MITAGIIVVVIRLGACDSRGFSESRSRKRKRWCFRDSPAKNTSLRRWNLRYIFENYGAPASRQNSVFFLFFFHDGHVADGGAKKSRRLGTEPSGCIYRTVNRNGAPWCAERRASSFSWFAISHPEWLASVGFLGGIRQSDFSDGSTAWDIISRPVLDA